MKLHQWIEKLDITTRVKLLSNEKIIDLLCQEFRLEEEEENYLIIKTVDIPSGKLLMGESDPKTLKRIKSFRMSKYPITQAQWRVVAGMPQIERELKADPSYFKGDNLPVERVSWYDAVEFCKRLSQYSGRVYRLPSEAEWEYACRAGTTTPFCFGETLTTKIANFYSNVGKTTPVGTYLENAYGLSDMHGNVWEWCQDHWHSNYDGAPKDGSAWEDREEDVSRVVRGGSWNYNPRNCRFPLRNNDNPISRYNDIGFRVVYSGF